MAQSQPTTSTRFRVLVISDKSMESYLGLLDDTQFHCACECVDTPEKLDTALDQQDWDLILYDNASLPSLAQSIVGLVDSYQPHTPVILTYQDISSQQAFDLLQLRVTYCINGNNREQLLSTIDRELNVARLLRQAQSSNASTKSDRHYYQSIVDHQRELICRYNTDFEFTFANQAYCEWAGKTAEEIIGQNLKDMIPDEDRETALTKIYDLSVNNPTAIGVHQSLLEDGQFRWIEWSDTAIFDEDNNIIEYQGVGRDVTAKHLMEQTLRDSEEMYRLTLSSISDAVFITDDAGEFTFICPNVETLYGYTQQEIFIKRHISSVLSEDLFDLETLKQVGEITNIEDTVVDKFGQSHDVLVNVKRISIKAGTILYTVHDVTERTQAQDALVAANEQYKSLVDSTDAGIVMADYEGTLLFANRVFADRVGFKADDVIGKNVHDFYGVDTERRIRAIQQVIDTGEGMTYEVKTDFTGEPRWYRASLQPVRNSHGQVTATLINSLDITDRKEIEESLQQNEARLRAVSEMMTDSATQVHIDDAGKVTKVWQMGPDPDASLGYDEDQFKSLDGDYAVIHREAVKASLQQTLDGQETSLEFRIRRANGQYQWRLVHRKPTWNDDGTEIVGFLVANKDITKQKEAEIALRENEQRFRMISELMSDSAVQIQINEDGTSQRVWQMGKPLEDVLGYNDNRLNGIQQLLEYVHPDDVTTMQKSIMRTLGGHETSAEYRLRHQDGHYRWFAVKRQPMWNADKTRVTDYVIALSDITARKEAEVLNQHYASIVSQSNDLIVMYNTDYQYILANAQYLKYGNLNRRDIIGKHIAEVMGQDHFETISKPNLDLCFKGERINYQTWHDYPDIGRRYLDIYSYPVFDARANIVGAVTTIRDLTDLRLAENERDFHSIAMQNLAEGVSAVDVETGKIVYANARFEMMFGYDTDELIGQPVSILNTDDVDGDAMTVEMTKAIENVGYWIGEIHNVRKDGIGFWTLAQTVEFHDEVYGDIRLTTRQDITDRKLAYDALQASETRFQQFMDHVPASIFIHSQDNQLVYCNTEYVKSMGTSREEMIRKPFEEYLDDDAIAIIRAENKAIIETKHTIQSEIDDFNIPGKRWSLVKFPIPQPDGTTYVGAIATDVTQKYQVQEALRLSEQRYRQMFELIQLPELIIDPDTGAILDANPGAAEFYGYTIHELQTMTIGDINQMPFADFKQKLADNTSITASVQQLADGTTAEMEIYSGTIEWYDQSAIYCVCIDVTQRNEAERHLQEINETLERRVIERTLELEDTKNRIEAIFNSSSDGILLFDIKDGILQANYTCDILLGTMFEEYHGKSLSTLIAPNDRDKVDNLIYRVREEQRTVSTEARVRRGGIYFHAEISISPIKQSRGGAEQLVCTIHDITNRIQAEAELRENEKLLRTIAANFPNSYLTIIESDYRIGFTSGREFHKQGLNPDQYTGQLLATVFRQFTGKFRREFERTFEGEEREFEFNNDGQYLLFRTVPLNTNDGSVKRILVVVENITERKQAENAIAEERNLLRTVIDAVPDSIYVKDTDHRMVLNNRASAKAVGYDNPLKLVGKTDRELFSEEMAAKFEADEEVLFQLEEPILDYEEQSMDGDGNDIWVLTSKVPLYTVDGDLRGLVGITRDISAIKENEEALRRSEEKLRNSQKLLETVLDTVPVGIYWKNLDRVYTGCNALAAKILSKISEDFVGVPSEVIGKTVFDMPWSDEAKQSNAKTDTNIIKTGVPEWDVQGAYTTVDGEHLVLHGSKLPLRDSTGNIIGIMGTIVDVTERETAAEQLRYLANIQQQIQDAVIGVDLDYTIRSWNKGAENMYGWTAEEVIGKPILDVIQTTYTDGKTEEDVAEILLKEGHWQGEVVQYHQDGTSINALTSVILNQDDAGNPIGVIVVNHDFTARKQAQEKIAESEARYRLLAHNVTDMISRHDADGNYLYATPSSLNLTGYSSEELVGTLAYEYFHPDDMPEVANSHGIITSTSTVFTVSYRFRHKRGHYLWLETTSHAIKDPETDEIIEIVAVSRDITDRKEAEAELRDVWQRLSMATDVGRIGVWEFDLSQSTLLWDDRMHNIYEIPKADFSGSIIEWFDTIHHADVNRVTAELDQSVTDLSPLSSEFRVITSSNQLKYMQIRADYHRDENNLPSRIVGVNLDITEQKEAEHTLLIALEKEKELGELKSRFVSMASHEFRTPLASIMATTETLSYYRHKMDEEQIELRLEKIRGQVDHMKDIMEDVLNLAKMQAGRIKFVPERDDFDALCQDIVEEFDSQPIYSGRIQYTCNAPTPLEFVFDAHLIRQVMLNFVHNALKYSDDNQPVLIDLSLHNGTILLKVRDRGIGIPEKDLKHLFEPFHRATNVGTISGTGLGLSIAKQAVEAHGGVVTVDSEVNEGTTFTIVIPGQLEGSEDDH